MKNINKDTSNIYNKKRILIIFCMIILLIPFTFTLSRYVSNKVNDFYTNSKEFYFNSDKLTTDNPVFSVENWSGVDNYTITINMNSRANEILAASYDIGYNISYTCSSNAICSLSKTNGVIYASTNKDYFNLVVTPNAQLKTGDKVAIEITATSTTAYTKTLKCRFTLVVGKENLSYAIVDSVNSPYLELNITNTLSYYNVKQAISGHAVGDKINVDTYLSLSDLDKLKCYSSTVTLTFDPTVIVLDLTDSNYLNAKNILSKTVNSYNYISGMTFNVEAISSTRVRFYKKDKTKDYSYPNSSNTSVIGVSNI
jgi:hypothetical protein